MKPLRFRFDINVFPGTLRLGLAGVLICLAPIDLSSESVTLATYYPAPSGVYTNMITTGGTRLARDGGSVAIGSNAAAGTRLTVMNGNVGIGTTAPTSALQITGVGGTNVDFRVNGRMWTDSGVWVDAAQSQFLGTQSATEFGIWNTGGWRMTVDNTGKVGIGVVPVETLDVNGTIAARGCAGVVATPYAVGVRLCPGGTYATWIRGIMSPRQTATATNVNGSGSMYCCPCAGATCPAL